MIRSLGRGSFGAAVVGIVACTSTVEPCVASGTMTGSWQYAAVQDAPVVASLSGTLVISRPGCRDFDGSLDVVELRQGQSQRLAAAVYGSQLDSTTVRFEVMFGPVAREHFGQLRGDSLVGSWAGLEARAATTGRFTARRMSSP